MRTVQRSKRLTVKDEDDIIKAMEITEELSGVLGFSPRDRLFLRLATEEACTNAYEYCQKTSQEYFLVFWKVYEKRLTICVKHQGPLFKVEKKDEINTSPRGRGLQLILNIMDHVQVLKQEENVLFFMHKYKMNDDNHRWRKLNGE
jgi:serine/threonine-protein kinase RsbW